MTKTSTTSTKMPAGQPPEASRFSTMNRRLRCQLGGPGKTPTCSSQSSRVALPVVDSSGWDDVPEAAEEEDEGDLSLSRAGPATVEELDLAPMVDVAFQLVLFFMVTATTVLYKTLEIPKPSSEQAPTTVAQGRSLEDLQDDNVLVEIDAAGGVKIDREPVPGNMDMIVERLRTTREKTNRKSMLLSADFTSKHRATVVVIDAAPRNRYEHRDCAPTAPQGPAPGMLAQPAAGLRQPAAVRAEGRKLREARREDRCVRHRLSTLLAMIGIVALAGAVAAAIFFFQPFGRRAWIALLQASIMGSLMIALGNNPRGTPVPAVSRYGPNGLSLYSSGGEIAHRCAGLLAGARRLVELDAGGPMPPAKMDRGIIRVVTWNILHGASYGCHGVSLIGR